MEENTREQIKDTASVTVEGKTGEIHCITIVGQIEGHQTLPEGTKATKYEHLMPQLAAIEESREIGGLLVLLNTVGGDIEAGLAIAEMISGMNKPTVSLVLGGGHSIGVPIAVAAKRSIIAPSAALTLHPVRLTGTMIGARQTYDYLARIQDKINDFITANSSISPERLTELMMETGELASDVGSIVYGEQAVSEGLIDAVGGLSDALCWLHGQIQAKTVE